MVGIKITNQNADQTHNFHQTKHNYLSYSQVADYLACQYRWGLRYHRGLHPKQGARPLVLGDAVHQCIAAYHLEGTDPQTTMVAISQRDWPQNSTPEQDEEYGEIVLLAPRLARKAILEFQELGWETVYLDGRPAVEIDLYVPLPADFGFDAFAMHLDWVCVDQNGTIRLVDYKVRSKFMPEDSERFNFQHATYAYGLWWHGVEVDGTVTYEIRNELPNPPKINKNGTVSRSAARCDWDTYKATILEAGEDPADYTDMEMKLADYKFTNPLHAYRTETELVNIWDTIILPAAHGISEERKRFQMNNLHQPIRTMKWFNCQMCQFKDPCTQALAGDDVGPMLTSLFNQV